MDEDSFLQILSAGRGTQFVSINIATAYGKTRLENRTKYVVNQIFEQFDDIIFRELVLGRPQSVVFKDNNWHKIFVYKLTIYFLQMQFF